MPLVIIIAVLGIAADQISKLIVAQTIPLEQSVTVIENVLYFTYTHNTGVAFGLFEGAFWLFIPITIIISAALMVACQEQACPSAYAHCLRTDTGPAG